MYVYMGWALSSKSGTNLWGYGHEQGDRWSMASEGWQSRARHSLRKRESVSPGCDSGPDLLSPLPPWGWLRDGCVSMFPQRGPWVLHEAQSCPASRSSSYASRRMEAGERRNRKEQGQTEDPKSYFCSDYHSGPWAKTQLLCSFKMESAFNSTWLWRPPPCSDK